MSQTSWIVLGVVVAAIVIVSIILAIRLVIRLVTVKRMLGELGAKGKWVFWGSIAYLIFPVDLLPDPIYFDDIAVLSGAMIFLTRLLRKQEDLKSGIPHAARVVKQVAARRRVH